MKSTVIPFGLDFRRRRRDESLALFLDFDGTLVPIAPRPEEAWLTSDLRGLLRRLSRRVPVAIISGRSLADIRSRVGVKEIVYVGNHGLEIDGCGLRYRMKDADSWRRSLKILGRQLRENLEILPGIFVEDKGCTLSIHYRLARGAVRRRAARWFLEWLKPFQRRRQIRLGRGKAVWEIHPPIDWDKGRAVTWILGQPRFRRRWPLYIGDDETDQDAFRAIRRIGLGIAVGPPEKKGSAHFAVRGPREVGLFLRRLLSLLSPNPPGSETASPRSRSTGML